MTSVYHYLPFFERFALAISASSLVILLKKRLKILLVLFRKKFVVDIAFFIR